MHDHGQIYSGIEGASPGRFAALVTKHEVVTLGKLGEERAQALGRAPVAAMSGFQIAVVHDCPERVYSVEKLEIAFTQNSCEGTLQSTIHSTNRPSVCLKAPGRAQQ
jgi:hypothetical protein